VTGKDGPKILSCAEVADLAPEMGLGVLTGVERANALAHVDNCAACRSVVEQMAEVADSLLALGPEMEPPAGFESRLLARAGPATPTRHNRRRWAVPTLAGLAAAAAVAVIIGQSGGQAGFKVQHPAALHAIGGRELSATALSHDGRQFGQAFVYAGRPSWVFMTVDSDGPPQTVTCELKTADGQTITVGSFTVTDGYRSWGSTISVNPDQIRQVLLVDPETRTVMASASL
jgi:hypothetical protein